MADALPSSPAADLGRERTLDLALQGGGSHGAYTWGVLDRLLEDEDLHLQGISGTSAGALNAGVLATGYHRAGRAGARDALRDFWMDVSHSGSVFAPFSASQIHSMTDALSLDLLPGYQWASAFFRSFSPYEFNPLNLHPLRDVLRRHVDEAAMRDCALHLFITATSVSTGQPHVFSGDNLSVDALLASACLPFLFQAIRIGDDAYWDGGYTGNPALFPLIYQTEPLDILLVRINPLVREGVPRRSEDIMDRISEISFNATLVAEMRAIAFVSRLVREGRLSPGRYKDLRLHMVSDDDGLRAFGANSKLNTDRRFIEQLFTLGRASADQWLAEHRDDIGVRGTLDIESEFLKPLKPPGTRP